MFFMYYTKILFTYHLHISITIPFILIPPHVHISPTKTYYHHCSNFQIQLLFLLALFLDRVNLRSNKINFTSRLKRLIWFNLALFFTKNFAFQLGTGIWCFAFSSIFFMKTHKIIFA